MTKKEAQAYRNRWRAVNQIIADELRHTPLEIKFKKMDAAYRIAAGLGLLPRMKALKQESEQEVRRRWLQLKTTTL
ncbi:MAG: hypothetical protein P0120_05375 [Nitrospira sp.]|nr:hypothetical protein [Nitrospira sp.]